MMIMKEEMKFNKVLIRIASFEQVMQETVETLWNVKKGKKAKAARKTLTFPDLETLREILTDERIRLLQTLHTQKPKSVYELAKKLGRKYPNVFNDVKKLENLGLVTLNLEKNKSEPTATYKSLKIEIPLTIPILNRFKVQQAKHNRVIP
ncbi:MAG: MarR family transcriptional regulator [Candidatus Micrarchaeota archaeon]